MVGGNRVGLLDLAQDLGLAYHHRIKAAGHSEEMAHGLWRGVVVEWRLGCGEAALLGKKVAESVESAERADAGGVEFDAVAGGENNSSRDPVEGAETLQHPGHLRFAHGKAFPHVDVGGAVIEAGAEDVHLLVPCGELLDQWEQDQGEEEGDRDSRGQAPSCKAASP